MKKRFLFLFASVFLVLAAAVTLLVLNVTAAPTTYNLWVAGIEVTSETLSGNGWSYDPDTSTLTLNGFQYGSGGRGYLYTRNPEAGIDYYAFIYTDKKGMELNIRLEGADSIIGDASLAGHAQESAGDGYYSSYFGIFNQYGTVNISGSARLNIYTNQWGIFAGTVNIDGCTKGVDLLAYSGCIGADYLNIKGGSRVTASCGYGNVDNNSPINIIRRINLYDTSELYSVMERAEYATGAQISGINCKEGTINVYGGKLTGICIAGGTAAEDYASCIGIQTEVLNISGGGIVEAYIQQASYQKDTYLPSSPICYYAGGNGTVHFKGTGVLRVGVEKKKPSGTQYLLPRDLRVADGLYAYDTATEKDGYELYREYSVFAREGIYLREQNGEKQWSYWSDFKQAEACPAGGLVANDVLPPNSGLKIIVLSGSHTLDPYVKGGSVSQIVIKGGSLTLKTTSVDTLPSILAEGGSLTLSLADGRTCAMGGTITVAKGAEITVSGDGILTDLHVGGNGKITFIGGTVSGQVEDSVTMVVEGGNINVAHLENGGFGYAVNSRGERLTRNLYTISSDNTYTKIELVTLWEGTYGCSGMYLLNGNQFWLWTPFKTNNEVKSVRASDDSGSAKTLKPSVSDPSQFSESTGVKAHWRSVYVAKPGGSVSLYPFFSIYTRAQGFHLIWSYSDDGLNWTEIKNPNMDGYGVYTRDNITMEECGRFFRCEIRDGDTDELLDTFNTMLYVLNISIAADGGCEDGKTTTFRLVEEVPIPTGKSVWVNCDWYLSTDGGNTFRQLNSATNRAQPYSMYITEDMDGYILRCQAKAYMQAQTFDGYVTVDTVIRVTNRTVKIDTQPDPSPVLDLRTPNAESGFAESILFSVVARNATHYQWQVAKRTAENPDAPFENIGDDSATFSFSAKSRTYDPATKDYVYRCIVSNDYGEVITEEIRPIVYYPPYIIRNPQNVSIGKDGNGVFEDRIQPGNPVLATGVYWMVRLPGENGFTRVSESEALQALFTEAIVTATAPDGTVYCVSTTLTVKNPTPELNGAEIQCRLDYEGGYRFSALHRLTVLTDCQQYGHDWADATCTAPATCTREGCGATTGEPLSHTGGKATCIRPAICEHCGEEYGYLDPTTHPDDATDVWNEDEWDDNAGHESKWSCCGKPKYAWEYHAWESGVCTVCGCVCNHSRNTPANCHEVAKCHTCGMEFGEIDPNNHDLSTFGTYTSDQKDPTCTEKGFTGNVCCYKCHGIIIPGAELPANGHDDSRAATCQYPAMCTVCGFHGEKDPNNHEYPWTAYYTDLTEATHKAHWDCCDTVTEFPHEFDSNGVCQFCHYGCEHSGGKATCLHQAQCEKCGESYGDYDPTNHETMYYPLEDGTHVKKCGCNFELNFSTPEPHSWNHGECEICRVSHIYHTESDYELIDPPLLGKAGKKYTECTVCHAELAFSTIAAIGFDTVQVRHNCSFGNDLSMLYAILQSDLAGCTDIRLIVKKEQYEGNVLAELVTHTLYPTAYVIGGVAYYRFDYTGVSLKELGDTLEVELVFVRDGNEYRGTVDTYSLRQYAMERLEKSEDASFKTLLVDLLNCGAAAQLYFGYRTDALVNAELSDEQRALSRGSYDQLSPVTDPADSTDAPVSITGRNILFGNRLELLFASSLGRDSDLSGISLRVRYTNRSGQPVELFISGDSFVYSSEQNGYIAYFDGLKVSELRTVLELAFVRDGKEISATVAYSFDNYASSRLTSSEDEAFKALLKQTLIYSDSAKDYFAGTTNPQ